jgi:hypothetical protein
MFLLNGKQAPRLFPLLLFIGLSLALSGHAFAQSADFQIPYTGSTNAENRKLSGTWCYVEGTVMPINTTLLRGRLYMNDELVKSYNYVSVETPDGVVGTSMTVLFDSTHFSHGTVITLKLSNHP